jgi:uncharacterized protein YndB with AHSA1/START domain
MVEIEVVGDVGAGPDRTWEVFTDHAGWSDWAGFGRVTLERTGQEHRDGTGCIRVLRGPGGVVREEVTEFDPPRRMTYRVLSGFPVRDHSGEVRVEPRGAGSRVTWSCRFTPRFPGTATLSRVIVALVFRRVLRRLAARLRARG